MSTLLDGGLYDTGHVSRVGAAQTFPFGGSGVNHSVPTALKADAMHAAAMRLDYAMANSVLAERCAVSSWLVRDAETDRLSDHYPLLTDISCNE